MTMFYQCGYSMRMALLIFFIITIMTMMFLLLLLVKWKWEKKRIIICFIGIVVSFIIYSMLLDDHIEPINAVSWHGPDAPFPIAILWIYTISIFAAAGILIVRTNRQHRNTVTEENIKEALDEVPLGICCFNGNGIPTLCNRRMQDISELMGDRIFMSYYELQEILGQREDWREGKDVFRFPDGTVCRYVEEELMTEDGERYLVSNFYDITELDKRKVELEAQNEELRKMAAKLLIIKENVHLLAKEEEILSIKARWHDVMGEGITAIRRTIISDQSMDITNEALKRWSEAVTTIQRDNEDPDQRRDAMGDLLRDAAGLQIELKLEGQMPEDREIQQVFSVAVRNCILNAAQHAKATELYVYITQTDSEDILIVENNGNKPTTEVSPRGGLINVLNHARRVGGEVEIQSEPRVRIKITVPRKE